MVLLLGAAVALVLAAMAWQRSAQAAGEAILPASSAAGLHGADGTAGSAGTTGAAGSSESSRDGLPDRQGLPGLNEMRGQTSEHADALQEALDSTN